MRNTNGEEDILTGLTCWKKELEGRYNSGCRIFLAGCQNRAPVTVLCSDSSHLDAAEDYDLDSKPEWTLGRFQRVIGALVRIRAVVVGLDLKEYSHRKPADQLFLTVRLEAAIEKARHILERGGILPEQEPRVVDPTGDGALAFFTCLNHYKKEGLPDADQ